MTRPPAIRAVLLDVGETIIDETGLWAGWAEWLGLGRHTVSAVVGAALAHGEEPWSALCALRPGLDLDLERRRRAAAGSPESYTAADLYADAVPALSTLREAGLRVGVAGNQTEDMGAALRRLELPVDVLGHSAEWRVHKPDAAFFARAVAELGVSAAETLHVGDRPDNDVHPARRAGLTAALLRRGPSAHLQAEPTDDAALFHLDGLTELCGRITEHNAVVAECGC